MKPDWKDAPEWANYLAMDQDGSWTWFQNRPHERNGYWWDHYGEQEEAAKPKNVKWRETCETRP